MPDYKVADISLALLTVALLQLNRMLVAIAAGDFFSARVIGAFRAHLAIGIERRCGELNDLSDIEMSRPVQHRRHRNLVDGHRRIRGGAVEPARADDDHFAQPFELFRNITRALCAGRRTDSKRAIRKTPAGGAFHLRASE